MYQKYPNGTTVYNFYFDYYTSQLVFKEFVVGGYDYMDGCQWNVIDEYRLEEYFFISKFYFFKKKVVNTYKICGHLISDNKDYAKTKFLYNFLNLISFEHDRYPKNIVKMHEIAMSEYKKIMENNPEYFFSTVTKKLSENNQLQDLWRY